MLTNEHFHELHERFAYDPETGIFIFKKSPNRRKPIGSTAGSFVKEGYVYLGVNGVNYLAHRVAYLMHYGFLPDGFIDHKDSDKWNNRIDNLRPASRSENAANSNISARNTTGVKGVYFDKRMRRYVGRLKKSNKLILVGTFATLHEADLAMREARVIHHGEFARHY